MSWIPLASLLCRHPGPGRDVALAPTLSLAELQAQALRLAGGLRERGVGHIGVHLEDAGQMAVVLLAAWRAGVCVWLPADLQPASRARLADRVELWLSDQPEDHRYDQLYGEALEPAALDPDSCRLVLCTSGSSGEPKLIEKHMRQLANEVEALERLWGTALGDACVVASVAAQHIYGLLFRVLWPLCAGRPFLRRALPFAEDLQLASRAHTPFCWVTSPALLKRMGDNLDWDALRPVRKVFSSGGALPGQAAAQLQARLGQWPTEIYGSSETGGIAWRAGETAWTLFADVQLSQREDGALQVRSPYLPQGQCEQTSDAALMRDDGRFELLGRVDRIVKLEEKRVSLPMLEAALAEHPWVKEARLGVVRENRDALGALVALSGAGLHALRNKGRRALTQALRTHLAGHCEPLALPRRWRLTLELPCNAQGKLPQAEIERCLAAPRVRLPDSLSQHQTDDHWLLELGVPVDLAHFTGHFPGTPVLPGVVQIDWALSLARQLMDLPPLFRGMEVLKFQQLARPGDRLHLTLRFDRERNKLHFAYRNGDAPCSSGRILLGEYQ
ncbi:AMP-binding protein [Stutzerimonas nosocomialis]|uniref:AMP-binding protein n=1 Tax=Stutzerimonas nosocomialis TaxID=1056496 RepID=UPI0011092EE3|nr:AMP-binding protein [Stutzerimonas nosocomialis]TLX60917.1 AMP-binding protein [Stutzerimonas nosocomialis]